MIGLTLICAVMQRAGASKPSSLADSTILNLYIDNPDSCLLLIDKAEQGELKTNLAAYRLDFLRAMCYEIKGDYHAKELCSRRLLENDSVRNDNALKLKATVMLAGVLDRQNRYGEAIDVCRRAVDLARELGKKKEEAEMLSTMARVSAGMKRNADAERYFRKAIELLETTDDVRDMSYLSTIYGELMTFLIDTDRGDKALETARKRERLIDKMSRLPGPPPGYIDQQYGFLYAKMALLLVHQGKNVEASEIYNKYKSLDFSDSYTGRAFIVPYLLAAGRFREGLANNSACLSEYPGDSISYDYLSMLQSQAEAYRGLKEYQSADYYMQRCYSVQDSIYRRESGSKAQEYAATFDAKEKELQLIQAQAESQREKILVAGSVLLILLLSVILWVVLRNLRRIKMKNRIDAERIDELIAQKEELRNAFSQMHQMTAPESLKSNEETSTESEENADKDYQAFMQMDTLIVSQQLFLNPRFGREDVLKLSGINKNSLPSVLRRFTGCSNLNDYINRLRLEYAVKLIKNNKLYTIDSIAESSGFNSRSTFYRVFQNVFGMTPSQYLETQSENQVNQ